MKRDPELIRDLMLAMEGAKSAELLKVPRLVGRDRLQVEHHFRLLTEAGLVTAGYVSPDGRRWIAIRLTWRGHEYLDQIRDPQVWRLTKAAMRKTGSWSLETMAAIAKSLIVARLGFLGVDVGI
ncbi:DUF2513 domain-containing protein [Sphingobium chlorophenolicum]|uniref:DUF2513 domain-containing protein n=1 Tax=Sphingobium chlorophenolicum TaxID=46429 RepID=A0A081RAC5_SPHCR|nr:DUF2513 domain-containing protein [Sphingobium chlorophenolicum]KEQ52148.1 hypothetical protein BV95_03565 [Sphingobium chlorophenolicum]